MTTPMVPTLHMNGTSFESLNDQIKVAYRAVTAAMEALQAASPNGRDYYPQGDGATQKALAEHVARGQKLAEVQSDLMAIREGLYSQKQARDAQRGSR